MACPDWERKGGLTARDYSRENEKNIKDYEEGPKPAHLSTLPITVSQETH